MSVPILVLNCGSSSIKFAVFDAEVDPMPRKPLWGGQVEGIGGASARLVEANAAPVPLDLDRDRPYHAALHRYARGRPADGRTAAGGVAHRVVHGGSKYAAPVRIDHAWSKT
jgi:acetate kinase